MYSDSRVVDFIERHFMPVRAHVKENRDEYQKLSSRFEAQWTPTILIIDANGVEQHRIEGFLPVDDFLSQVALGVAKAAFAQKNYANASPLFQQVVDEYPNTEAAAEALYWTGVAKYRATNDPSALKETAQAFRQRYQGSSWAKKASVW